MARFTFRLDPVLVHRQRLEEEQQLVFAAALSKVAEAERLRKEYVERRELLRANLREGHAAMDGDELRATYAHCAFLDRAIVAADGAILEAQRVAALERSKLLVKTKETKVLATLKERRRESFEFEAAQTEQREMDEINSRRFDRSVDWEAMS